MFEIIIPGLYLLSGICAYAAVNHLSVGLKQPFDPVQVMFAGLCLLVIFLSLSHILMMQAEDVEQFVAALKWNLNIVFSFLTLFIWFIAQYTKKRPLPILVGLSILFVVLMVANNMQPYSVQYDAISGLRSLHLPWGETVIRAVGHNGGWAHTAIAGALLAFGYALYALGGCYRSEHGRTSLYLMLAVGLLLLSAIEGILVRLSMIDFIEGAPFGYLGMVIVMSVVLTREPQQRLRNSENRFRSLVENTPDTVARYDRNCRRIYANPRMQADAGIPLDELLNKTPEEFPGGEMAADYQARIRHVIENGEPVDFDLDWRSGDDKAHSSHIRLTPEFDANGKVATVLGVGRDITERKQAEQQLRMMDFALNHVREAVFLIHSPKSITYVNEEACRVLGYSLEELLNKTLFDIDPDADLEELEEINNIIHRQGYHTFERRHRAKDGRIFPVEILSTPFEFDGQKMSIALARDITERKLAEATLRESEEKYRTLIQKIQAAVVVHGADTRIITCNAVAQQILGLTEDQMLGKTAIDPAWHFFSEDRHPLPPDTYPVNKVLASSKSLRDYVVGVHHPGQENDVWVLVNADPVFDNQGAITQVVVTFIDITQRKQAEEAVAVREREFRTLAENLPDYIVRYDREGRTIYVNPNLEKFLGTTASERMGKTVREWHRDGSFEDYARAVDSVLASGKEAEIEMIRPGPDGEIHEVFQIRMVAERDEQGGIAGVLAIGHDITALKQAEERLEKTQAELRELATRIEATREEERRHIARELHDELGQLLTAIRMGVSHLKLEYEPDDARFQERMQRIVDLVDKTIQHLREVVTMLRPAVLERGIVAALEWLTDEFKARTGIVCELHVNKEKIDLDEEHAIAIFRIVQESLTNVTRHADADWVLIELECKNGNCHLKVGDNGKGFEPTQQKKKSLGLVGVRERVLRLGGEVKIDSALNRGTTVEVLLPLKKSG